VTDSTVRAFNPPEGIDDPLTEILRLRHRAPPNRPDQGVHVKRYRDADGLQTHHGGSQDMAQTEGV